MKVRFLALAIALALAGCATTPTPLQVTTAQVKVKERCIEKAPVRPAYRFGKGERPKSDAEKAQILAGDFEKAEQYGYAWEAAAAGCLVLPPAESQ